MFNTWLEFAQNCKDWALRLIEHHKNQDTKRVLSVFATAAVRSRETLYIRKIQYEEFKDEIK